MSTIQLISATVSAETSPTLVGSRHLITTTATPETGSSTTIFGTRVTVKPPSQAYTHTPHKSLRQCGTDPFDNKFGVSHSSPGPGRIAGTRKSRHDPISPPYNHGEHPPTYSTWDKGAEPKLPTPFTIYMLWLGCRKSGSFQHFLHSDLRALEQLSPFPLFFGSLDLSVYAFPSTHLPVGTPQKPLKSTLSLSLVCATPNRRGRRTALLPLHYLSLSL